MYLNSYRKVLRIQEKCTASVTERRVECNRGKRGLQSLGVACQGIQGRRSPTISEKRRQPSPDSYLRPFYLVVVATLLPSIPLEKLHATPHPLCSFSGHAFMSVRSLLRLSLTLLLPIALLSTLYLYLYPGAQGCSFPIPWSSNATERLRAAGPDAQYSGSGYEDGVKQEFAPFRLLVLADPQLEGDSSLPDPGDRLLPTLNRHWQDACERNISWTDRWSRVSSASSQVVLKHVPSALQALRKRVDLLGNDYYLAHIYRTMKWWTQPTHITVLGDLIGSQWVTDDEFEQRGERYWHRVFAGGRRVNDDITRGKDESEASTFSLLDESWTNRVINIAGNHDIGYAGDISEARVARFERTFGRANWDVRFEYPKAETTLHEVPPSIHLIILNSLNLDTPALSPDLQHASYEFINTVIGAHSRPVEDRSSFTLLLTHLPLHKPDGVCVDGPYFDFYDFEDTEGRFKDGGLKEQNHLSDHGSRHGILEGIFGMSHRSEAPGHGKGRNGLILTGHDHEGCDTLHYIATDTVIAEGEESTSTDEANWQATRWHKSDHNATHAGVREITLRSMMGEFGGNAGLLSAWFDFEAGEWRYEIQMCKFGVQHIWWAVHVLDVVTSAVALAWALTTFYVQDKKKATILKTRPNRSTTAQESVQDIGLAKS